MKRRFFLGLFPALLGQSKGEDPFTKLPPEILRNARMNGIIMIRHPEPLGITSHATLITPSEPGERLTVHGQVVDAQDLKPRANVTVYAYNTDAQGYYGENKAEYPPRLYGWARTDREGRFELSTIKPGRYPTMRVPAHIHFALWGAGFPPQGGSEVQFEGDSYLTPQMLAEDRALGEFRMIQPLRKAPDGTWECSVRIKAQHTSNWR